MDIGHTSSLGYLNSHAQALAIVTEYGFDEADAATIRTRAPRAMTQRPGRLIFEMNEPRFAGVAYASRFGDDLTNWAIFEDRRLPRLAGTRRSRGPRPARRDGDAQPHVGTGVAGAPERPGAHRRQPTRRELRASRRHRRWRSVGAERGAPGRPLVRARSELRRMGVTGSEYN